MHTLDIEETKHARKIVRWMGLGVMPSQDQALRAQAALSDYAAQPEAAIEPKTAIRVIRSIGIGIAPSEEMCRTAEMEVAAIIDSIRDRDSASLRESGRQRG